MSVMPKLASTVQGKMFGEAFSLDLVGLSDLPADTAVPGVAVFSRRAVPLAAWTRCATAQLKQARVHLRCRQGSLPCWNSPVKPGTYMALFSGACL